MTNKYMKKIIAVLSAMIFLSQASAITVKAPLVSPEEIRQVKLATCEYKLKELQINNNCEEVKQVIDAFNGDKTMVSIILQESHFNRNAKNVNKNGSVDSGYFQINLSVWSYENRFKNNGLYFKTGDLDNSIEIAKYCYQTMGYKCWAAYTNQSYLNNQSLSTKIIDLMDTI